MDIGMGVATGVGVVRGIRVLHPLIDVVIKRQAKKIGAINFLITASPLNCVTEIYYYRQQ
jgi:hypothetical protein